MILTEAGPLGPFRHAIPFFRGARWLCAAVGLDGQSYLLVDGHPFGPYDHVATGNRPRDRTEDHDWIALGFRPDGPVDVFLTGHLAMTTPPFQYEDQFRELPSCRGSHWNVVGRQGDQIVLVEDGQLSPPLGPFKRLLKDQSEDRSRLAVRVADTNNQWFVLFRDASFGPYPSVSPGRPTSVQFAPDGSHWSFGLFTPGARRVMSDRGELPGYDGVVDWTVTSRGTVYVGRQGTCWWLHVGDDRFGPFEAAGVVASGDEVTAVVVSYGRVQVRAY
jgi:hypothetical protein